MRDDWKRDQVQTSWLRRVAPNPAGERRMPDTGPSFDEMAAFVARSRQLEEARREARHRARLWSRPGARISHWLRVVTS